MAKLRVPIDRLRISSLAELRTMELCITPKLDCPRPERQSSSTDRGKEADKAKATKTVDCTNDPIAKIQVGFQ